MIVSPVIRAMICWIFSGFGPKLVPVNLLEIDVFKLESTIALPHKRVPEITSRYIYQSVSEKMLKIVYTIKYLLEESIIVRY